MPDEPNLAFVTMQEFMEKSPDQFAASEYVRVTAKKVFADGVEVEDFLSGSLLGLAHLAGTRPTEYREHFAVELEQWAMVLRSGHKLVHWPGDG